MTADGGQGSTALLWTLVALLATGAAVVVSRRRSAAS
jgi:hypothetical protein